MHHLLPQASTSRTLGGSSDSTVQRLGQIGQVRVRSSADISQAVRELVVRVMFTQAACGNKTNRALSKSDSATSQHVTEAYVVSPALTQDTNRGQKALEVVQCWLRKDS